jgi:hypothetical protein
MDVISGDGNPCLAVIEVLELVLGGVDDANDEGQEDVARYLVEFQVEQEPERDLLPYEFEDFHLLEKPSCKLCI